MVANPETLRGPLAAREETADELRQFQFVARSDYEELPYEFTGYVAATSDEQCRRLLAAAGLRPRATRAISGRRRRPARWGAKQMAEFADQVAARLRTGLNFPTALQQIAQTATNARLKRALTAVVADIVENGLDVPTALRRHPHIFTDEFVGIYEIGAQTGHLVAASAAARDAKQETGTIELFRDNMQRQADAQRMVKRAQRYPKIVAVAAAVATGVMLYTFVPAMANVLDSLNTQLPLPTRLLLAVSNFLTSLAGVAALGGAVAGWFALKRYLRGAGRARWQQVQLRLPKVGLLVRHYWAAQVSSYIALLTASGLSPKRAVEETAKSIPHASYRQMLEHVARHMEIEGASLADSLRPFAFLMGYNIYAVCLNGEADGRHEYYFRVHAAELDAHVHDELEKIGETIEPLLIGVIGLICGAIILSCYLPLFQAIKTLATNR